MSCGGSLSQKWLNMVKLFNIKSSWNHAYACLLAGNNMCKKTTHVPLHITGSRAEPYTPEISADSIRALLLACWPGAVLNSFWIHFEHWTSWKGEHPAFFIKHIKSDHEQLIQWMGQVSQRGTSLDLFRGSHIRLPLEDPQPASWPFCLQGLQEIHGNDGRSIYPLVI